MLARVKEIRDRLRNPVNGHFSEETEILSAPDLRWRQIAEDRAQRIRELLIEIAATRGKLASAQTELRRYRTGDAPVAQDAPLLPTEGKITLRQIINAVCQEFQVSLPGIMSRQQIWLLTVPRKVIYYLASDLTRLSFAEIGRRLERDHTTVLVGCRSIKKAVESGDGELKTRIAAVKRALGVNAP